MGHGNYSYTDRLTRATSLGYYDKPREEIFTQQEINNDMNPYGIKIRESRDSDDHPQSLGIIIALDETGSMGSVPHHLVQDGLPNIMNRIFQAGIPDPQILFLGIGDHRVDRSPLQVGQFESNDELLDKWLTNVYLEGNGGGNNGESYMLAWYFAAFHTAMDCWEKRQQKGFLFTIGDEPCHDRIGGEYLKRLMGTGEIKDFESSDLLVKAMETFYVYHINISETSEGSRKFVYDHWKERLHDNLLIAENHDNIPKMIADTIVDVLGNPILKQEDPTEENISDDEEMML